jgi:hypothetical protein
MRFVSEMIYVLALRTVARGVAEDVPRMRGD